MRCVASRDIRLIWSTTLLLSVVAAACCAQQPDSRLEHLLQAAVHLEQAELPAQAAEIRELLAGQDEQFKRRLLEDKLARIEQLRLEVAQLQQALEGSDDRTKVILRLKVLELSLDKLSQVGLNLVSIRQLVESESPTTLVDTGGDILQFLNMLQAQGFAELIAERTLMTRDGLRASLPIGSAKQGHSEHQIVYADPNAARRGGLLFEFECTPKVGQLGLLQLDLVLRRLGGAAPTAMDSGDTADAPNGEQQQASTPQPNSPMVPQRPDGIHTTVEMLGGQTLILAYRNSSEQANQSIATLLLLESEMSAPPQKKEKTQK